MVLAIFYSDYPRFFTRIPQRIKNFLMPTSPCVKFWHQKFTPRLPAIKKKLMNPSESIKKCVRFLPAASKIHGLPVGVGQDGRLGLLPFRFL